MIKIMIFMPRLDMKDQFEKVIARMPKDDEIKIELTYVFGTPESLSKYQDADIMVARGMSYERLHQLFPEKYMVQVKFSSYDIMDALIESKEKYNPKSIALCIHNQELRSLAYIEKLCGARIDIYKVYDQESAQAAIEIARQKGTDVFVGAGTMCGICDEMGLQRTHIHTKEEAIEIALIEAVHAARTINLERTKSNIITMMLNNSEEAVIAIDGKGQVLAINNQAYRIYQLSTLDNFKGQPVSRICKKLKWETIISCEGVQEEILNLQGKNYYVQYKPIEVDKYGAGALIFTRNADKIIEDETKIRRGLSEKGLTAKYTFKDIIGHSRVMRDNITMAERYSKVNSNVLIIGETGTGKELFAHSIHQASNRSNQPFVALNCAALPENLLESELFGYESGAFSGASKGGKIGLFELAHKGTIFLDEIGEIPSSLQAKLLRVLQEKEIRRIGSTSVNPVDVRVISATNINIDQQIKEGKFRADLYYRLNLLDIFIPPLRERKEDIQDIVDYCLTRFACEQGKKIPVLTVEAAKLLKEYEWPGNIRELKNICERLVVLNDTGVITENQIRQQKIFRNEIVNEKQQKEHPISQEADIIYSNLQPKKKKKEIADELGVSRTTLWRMTKKLNQ